MSREQYVTAFALVAYLVGTVLALWWFDWRLIVVVYLWSIGTVGQADANCRRTLMKVFRKAADR